MRSGCAQPRRQPPAASPSPRCWSAARRVPCLQSLGGPVSPPAPGPLPPLRRRARVTHRVPALAGSQRSSGGSLQAGKRCRDASCPKPPGFRLVFLTSLNYFIPPLRRCPAAGWMEGGRSSSRALLRSLSLQDMGATGCRFGEAATTVRVTRSTQLPRPWGDVPGAHPFPPGPRHTGQRGGPQRAVWEHPGKNPRDTATGQVHGTQHQADISKNHPARRQIFCGSCHAPRRGGPCCGNSPCPQPHQGSCPRPAPGCPRRLTEPEKPAGREPGSSWPGPTALTPKFLQPASETGQQR